MGTTNGGAAYGYRPDIPGLLGEDDPLRGNPVFAYADHKRQVEKLLARHRVESSRLQQVVFRACTILGETADNQITTLFSGSKVRSLRSASDRRGAG